MDVTNTIGRRKGAVARIYLQEGKGNITVNNKSLEEYFPVMVHQILAKEPLTHLGQEGNYNVVVNVNGGGITGQSEAIKLAIARALCEINPENRPLLKERNMLTRDSRVVERKKFGQKKARKRFQFSKR
jgi:small subunit ribosomal protein S9